MYAVYAIQDEKNQVLTTYVWYRQVGYGQIQAHTLMNAIYKPSRLKKKKNFLFHVKQWIDEFLVWNPEDFDDVRQISIPTANVWVPDILINEL